MSKDSILMKVRDRSNLQTIDKHMTSGGNEWHEEKQNSIRCLEGGQVEQSTGANPVEAMMGKALQPEGTAKAKALSPWAKVLKNCSLAGTQGMSGW